MKAAGLELALSSRNRGDLREGMGQVTTKWDGSRGQEPGRDDESPPRPDPQVVCFFKVCVCNDPSAGSPTETLLRLLLPLNDKV